MRAAVSREGVAVLVIPGDVLPETAAGDETVSPVRRTASVSRPVPDELAVAAALLDPAQRVTILAGAGHLRPKREGPPLPQLPWRPCP